MATDDYYCESILSGLVPVKVVAETPTVLAFHHTFPSWDTHFVVIPKRHVRNLVEVEDPGIFAEIMQVVVRVVRDQGLADGGYKVIVNGGSYQSNQHLHVHVVAGKPLDRDNPAQKGEMAV